jgi:pimeloyl-[acyl-carrier protein] methyl ester esterase
MMLPTRAQKNAMPDSADKPSLMLLPGADGSGLLFEPLIALLSGSTDLTVVRYPADVQSYQDALQYAERCLPAARRFFVLGESFSGPVAIRLAARHPARIAGVILAASFSKNPHPLLRPLCLLPAWPMPALCLRSGIALMQSGFSNPAMEHLLLRALSTVPARILQRRLQHVLQEDARAELKKIKQPLLYLQARHDRMVPATALDTIKRLAPQTDSVVLEAPHLVLQYASSEAARAILQFLLRPCVADTPAS